MMCAWRCRCLSLEYCLLSVEMSSVIRLGSKGLDREAWTAPWPLFLATRKAFEMPQKAAATIIWWSESASLSSSSPRKSQSPWRLGAVAGGRGLMLYV